MAITWNTGTTVSNGGSAVASQAVTIPAGVRTGDTILFVVSAFHTLDETIQASSTGTTPVIIGSSQNVGGGGFVLNAALFYVVATASDPGSVITASFVSGDTANWAIALGAWSGTSTTAPIDVSGVATAQGASSTITCPSETTGVAGDWDLQIVGAGLGGSAYTGGTGFTQRESISDASSGATGLIFDSNAAVGVAGTSIGGATFANAGNNSWWAGWTVGLAVGPPPPPPPPPSPESGAIGGWQMLPSRGRVASVV
jgi:hypothetical protein